MNMLKNYKHIKQIIVNKKYKLFIADTYLKKRKGLSGLRSIPNNTGMIFVYGKEEKDRIFTMKNVMFPLKIIFLNKANEVVYSVIARPGQRILCKKPSMYVVEIPV